MEPIEIRDMLYILAVCEERSFSRAAEKYYISQPALSKIVKRGEGNLGTQIFDRGLVPLKITPQGEVFVEYFKKMKELHQEMEQLLSAYYLAGTGAGITFIRASIPYYVGPSQELIYYKVSHPDTSRDLRAYYNGEKCTTLQKIFVDHLISSPMPG